MNIKHLIGTMLGGVLFTLVASQAHAAAVTDTSIGTDTLITSTSASGVIGTDTNNHTVFTANTYAAVYAEPVTGYLDFVYQVQDVTGDAILSVAGSRFASGFHPVAYYDTTDTQQFAAPYETPDFATTSSETVNFDFGSLVGSPIGIGEASYLLVVKTTATNYIAGNLALQDGGNGNTPAYQPAAAVPEPSTVASFGLGGFGLLALMLRARKARKTVA